MASPRSGGVPQYVEPEVADVDSFLTSIGLELDLTKGLNRELEAHSGVFVRNTQEDAVKRMREAFGEPFEIHYRRMPETTLPIRFPIQWIWVAGGYLMHRAQVCTAGIENGNPPTGTYLILSDGFLWETEYKRENS